MTIPHLCVRRRFFLHVDVRRPNECWHWIGARNPDGYGNTTIDGKRTKAHRVSWHIHNGPIPEHMHVLHHCDNRACVNPTHLFLGSHQDNMNDMRNKARRIDPKSRSQRAMKWLAQAPAGTTINDAAARYKLSYSVLWRAIKSSNVPIKLPPKLEPEGVQSWTPIFR